MKKLLLSLCFFLLSISAIAQANYHLKFKGIPITGTISQFQAQLTAKGCTYDRQTSAALQQGTRAFKGTLAGEKANIFVYLTAKAKPSIE